MEGIRQWGFSVCVALVVCGIAQILLPKNNLEKVFRLTVSVFFLCCLLSPVVLQNPQLRLEVTEYAQEDIDRRAQRLLEVVENQTEEVAGNGVREIVEDKLAEMGIKYTSIAINIKTNGQSETVVDSIDLILDGEHREQHQRILEELERGLGLDFRLGYEGGGDEEE